MPISLAIGIGLGLLFVICWMGFYLHWAKIELALWKNKAELWQRKYELQKEHSDEGWKMAGSAARSVDGMIATLQPIAEAFDDRTMRLLRLAVGTANEEESRTAAVQVCKRIAPKVIP